jgi:hypothetical protein
MSDVNENDNSQPHQDGSDSTLSLSPLAKELGCCVGPYMLLSVLGEGVFGIVYLAEQ